MLNRGATENIDGMVFLIIGMWMFFTANRDESRSAVLNRTGPYYAREKRQ